MEMEMEKDGASVVSKNSNHEVSLFLNVSQQYKT
jgi:hypothetical protein